MLIQRSPFFFRPLATSADYSLGKDLKLAEMDEQSVEVQTLNTEGRQLATGHRPDWVLFVGGDGSVVLAAKLKLDKYSRNYQVSCSTRSYEKPK